MGCKNATWIVCLVLITGLLPGCGAPDAGPVIKTIINSLFFVGFSSFLLVLLFDRGRTIKIAQLTSQLLIVLGSSVVLSASIYLMAPRLEGIFGSNWFVDWYKTQLYSFVVLPLVLVSVGLAFLITRAPSKEVQGENRSRMLFIIAALYLVGAMIFIGLGSSGR